MNLGARKFFAASFFAALSISAHAAPVVFLDTLAIQSPFSYTIISTTQQLGLRLTNGASSTTVNQVTMALALQSGGGTPEVRVCGDGAGGTSPEVASCTTFTALDPVSLVMGNVRFQGSKTIAAGASFWVISRSTVGGNDFRWSAGAGSNMRVSTNSGATWFSSPMSLAVRVDGVSLVVPGTAPIPTMTEMGLLLMSGLLVMSAWVFRMRGKA